MKVQEQKLRYGSGGLLPAVIQDRSSGRVLMLAYMNRRALKETLESGRTVFWSRSRKQLWKKGETSGHLQRVRSVSADCDRDALLVQVEQAGPACHTGRVSCFFEHLKGRPTIRIQETSAPGVRGRSADRVAAGTSGGAAAVLEQLDAVIRSRRGAPAESSYTARLFQAGLDRILRKVGEEAAEVIVAAKNSDSRALAEEAADLVYHLLVLLEERGVGLEGLARVLARRRKESMK
ncbi:MAG: bifunctional phosphoribosyl-AMP cyclohydrolase/phosphoribosyl-ATP diphosphatase HisIE [Acidobacteriota bacterium]